MISTKHVCMAICLLCSNILAEDPHEGHQHPPPAGNESSDTQSPKPATHEHGEMPHEAHGADAHSHGMMTGMLGPYAMTRESSGTSWQPEASPLMGQHWMKEGWMLMLHGDAQIVFDHQGGERGGEKFFSNNMLMFMASHEAGNGTFGFRTMLSAEPATIGKHGYPELLQTGETANGRTPLIDRQHPHDLFMELAASYEYNLSADSSIFTYFGYPGEPALGPPTFMHRFSGMEIPEAPITHHWLDSTHITYGVETVGYVWRNFKFDTSVFTGREPDEKRYEFDHPTFDSYSFRASYNPGRNWALQISYGHLHSPEQLESEVNTERITASVMYHLACQGRQWQTTLAFGDNRNHPHGHNLSAVLLESTVTFEERHTLFARGEWVEKDELFQKGSPLDHRIFNVGKIATGYIYDFYSPRESTGRIGIGILGSVGILPDSLHPAYGNLPLSGSGFIRLKF